MRRDKAVLTGAGVLCAGLLYGYVLIPMGIWIPCYFHRVTGLRCPGCGITALCLELLHGHFVPSYNYGLALAAPVLLWLLWTRRIGRHRRAAEAVTWALLAFLLLWAVLRNLWGI